jgi:hypothetical protein
MAVGVDEEGEAVEIQAEDAGDGSMSHATSRRFHPSLSSYFYVYHCTCTFTCLCHVHPIVVIHLECHAPYLLYSDQFIYCVFYYIQIQVRYSLVWA